MNKTLYKKDTKGKIRILVISTIDNKLYQASSLKNGKVTVHETECKGKNVSKSNETTDIEQAEAQGSALVIKKLKEGYFETEQEALDYINLMPMLAVTMDLDKVIYPVIVQPKLDGIRCIGTNNNKLSRKNREFTTLNHINLSFLEDNIILDGELMDLTLSFQENTKRIKKYRKGLTETIKYHVYDLPSHKGTFGERYEVLWNLGIPGDNIVIVDSFEAKSKEDVLKYHSQFLAEGYEGTMVRTSDTKYEFNKRSKSLIKVKDFKDEEFEIIDIIPTEKIPTHGTVVCKLGDFTFKCGNKLSHTEREDLLTNKKDYIGQQAKVSYFEKTDGGIPRFPVFLGCRMKEDLQ